jgi:hypothetical protein
MAPSNFTPNERLLRKRLAARLRQRRCRERKRELIMAGIVMPRSSGVAESHKLDSSVSVEGTTSGENSTAYSSAKSTPASSPSKVDPVYVNIQNMRVPPQGYGWTYPILPPIPRSRVPPSNYHHHPPPPPSIPTHPNGYYMPSSHHQQNYHHAPLLPVMYPPHHQFVNHSQAPPTHTYMPQRGVNHGPPYHLAAYGPPPLSMHQPIEQLKRPYHPTAESDPGDVSRTVSRSPSDASLNSGKAVQKDKVKNDADGSDESHNTIASLNATSVSTDETVDKVMINKKKKQKLSHKLKNSQQKSLMSTEKAAVAAMLAMKSSSDESDGDSISTGTNKTFSGGHQPSSSANQQQSISLIASV